jgi:hypothetical protein
LITDRTTEQVTFTGFRFTRPYTENWHINLRSVLLLRLAVYTCRIHAHFDRAHSFTSEKRNCPE